MQGTAGDPGGLPPKDPRRCVVTDQPKQSDGGARISISREYEVQYWTQVLGVSEAQLASIIARVGNSPAAVRRELNK